jgi:agmatine deiminase
MHILILLFLSLQSFAVLPDQKNLPIGLAPWEAPVKINKSHSIESPPPVGPIHSLGEWEQAEAVMTLWTNPSYIKALADHGPVKILADSESGKKWWLNWLAQNNISSQNFSFFIVPTNSIWVRDYGPWWILDGQGQVGIVDTIYNRPRPLDDVVPGFIAKALNIPIYQPGLVHTGGNYYSDGLGNAFSSTLVFKENSQISHDEVLNRMFSYLGINPYTTAPLGERLTIEHMDTFGKLVAPDTWVFSEFPTTSAFYKDAENMVGMLKNLKSPYGTPYKVFRLKMRPRFSDSKAEDYRAYINSFISNKVLYYPTYGNDAFDIETAKIYQEALPGYQIVGVANGNTEWGDSVHCRSRNLIKRNGLFIFPVVNLADASNKPTSIDAEVTTPTHLSELPEITWKLNGVMMPKISMEVSSARHYKALIPAQNRGSHIAFYISAHDAAGLVKTEPAGAPERWIEFDVP